MTTYTSIYPSPIDATTVKATSEYTNYPPYYGCDSTAAADYYSDTAPGTSNQKFAIDYGVAFVARRLTIENSHSAATDRGIYNFKLFGTNSAAAITNVGDYADETDLVILADNLVANSYDESTNPLEIWLIDNATEYRYYVLKIADNHGGNLLGFRQMELQSEDGYVPPSVAAKLLKVCEMSYGDLVIAIIMTTEMPYTIRFTRTLNVDMPYGIQLELSTVMYYGDAPTLMAATHMHYGDAAALFAATVMRYGDTLPLLKKTEMPYHVRKGIFAITEARYGINGEALMAVSDQLYSLSEYNLLIKKFDLPYLLQSDALVQRVTTTLSINNVDIDFTSINLECSLDNFAITAETHIARQSQFVTIKRGDQVTLTCNTDTYNLLVSETPTIKQTKVGENLYVVNLSSPAIVLTAPWSRPLQQEFSPGTAENIINSMLAAAGLQDCIYETVTYPVLSDTLYANNEDSRSIIRKLNKSVGAKIQSDPDGTVRIVPEYIKGWNTDADINYYMSGAVNFISQDESPDRKSGKNVFLVGNTMSSDQKSWPEKRDISVDEKEVMGFQVPWGYALVTGLTHSGGDWVNSPEYMGIVEETFPAVDEDAEIVEFKAGFANASKPIYGNLQVEWLRENLGAITYAEDGSLEAELKTGTTEGYSLAAIRYTTKYHLWKVRDAVPEDVQYLLWIDE